MRIACLHSVLDDPVAPRPPAAIAADLADLGLTEVAIDLEAPDVPADAAGAWLESWAQAVADTRLRIAWTRAAPVRWPSACMQLDAAMPLLVPRDGTVGATPADSLRCLVAQAAELRREMLVETAADVFPDARTASDLWRSLPTPGVALEFDLGAYARFNPGANVEIALLRVIDLVGAVRMRDVSGSHGDDDWLAPGEGAGEFARLAEIFQSMAFRGPCVIDFGRRRGAATLPATRRRLRDALAYLGDCGWHESRKFA
ncbi:MAG: hypothetical protein K1X74_16335 [Pirellulales bacterium]|nr:hypothetical protein [Pirellulales bacterium]